MVDDHELAMEVDSGASFTLIGRSTYHSKWPGGAAIRPADIQLSTWTSELLDCPGCFYVKVNICDYKAILPLMAMKTSGPGLLGHNCFAAFGICVQVPAVHAITVTRPAGLPGDRELRDYTAVFAAGLKNYTGPPVYVMLRPGVQPLFRQPRPVPYAKLPRIHAELARMVEKGSLEPITNSEWRTLTDNVDKTNHSVRVGGDYSGTVNPLGLRDVYPMTSVNHMLDTHNLVGLQWFAELDLAGA